MRVESLKFRAKDEHEEWHYSDTNGLYDFFYGIDDGQLDGETLEQLIKGEWVCEYES